MDQRFVLKPGQTCQFNFDESVKPMFYIPDQSPDSDEGAIIGEFIEYEWIKFVMYDGFCVQDETGKGGLDGKFMDFRKMYDPEKEGSFCKYFIYFTAATCGDCADDARKFHIFTFVDNTPRWGVAEAMLKSLWL